MLDVEMDAFSPVDFRQRCSSAANARPLLRGATILHPQAMPKLVIISGGQTGVDRAALDTAIALGVPYGGWCPHGGWAEDAPVPPGVLTHYPHLRETPSADPAQRTEWNVRDSDACLILLDTAGVVVSGGTALAQRVAAHCGRPLREVDVNTAGAADAVRAWLEPLLAVHPSDTPFRFAIGGPRESEAPGIYGKARAALTGLLGGMGFEP
jgi:hypothetical protein